ncbi:Hpt domain-containing protein, partial [Escherichia coli]|uniref:Hpt domain-containing protein n=1 Tax=Escherichia coli TaxID=562 RepID=UPI00208EE9D6
PKTSIICSPMTSLKTSIKTITYLSDTGCLEIQGASLYTEAATSDFAALAQTAHRLKGVFAMLNLVPGKQLCETLEHLIREKDVPGIEKYISDIDSYVKSLL